MNGFEEKLRDCCHQLLLAGVCSDPGQELSLCENGKIFFMTGSETPDCTDLKNSGDLQGKEPGWLSVHRAVYRKHKNFRVLVRSKLPYTMTAAFAGENVPPLLDDFAQLVGVDCQVVEGDSENSQFIENVVRALIRRNAVLIPGWGGLCGAGTFDDALAVVQVLEKGCQALVETSFLGGGHRINTLEAWLMRVVYRYKYSKKGS
jgi:L-fuculose-phosphate aldolase